MARHLQGRHDVTLVTCNVSYATMQENFPLEGDSEVRTFDGIRYFLVRMFRDSVRNTQATRVRGWFLFAWHLLKESRRLPAPDVIVGSSPTLVQALAAERLARRYRVPFVLEIRDLWPETLVRLGGYSPRNPIVLGMTVVERYLYRRASRIITLMAESVGLIEARGGTHGHVAVVPNGVDFGLVDAPTDCAPLDPRRFNVLYTGAHGLANALDAVLDAAVLVAAAGHADVHFTFIGDGEHKARLVARCAEEGIRNVTFLPAIPKKDIYGPLRQADVLILNALDAALYDHGVSFNKIFDYLAVAKPTVFAVPSDIMEKAEAGITCPPNDARAMAEAVLALRAMTPEARAQMGARGRAYARAHYDVADLARRFEQALVEAVDDQSRAGRRDGR